MLLFLILKNGVDFRVTYAWPSLLLKYMGSYDGRLPIFSSRTVSLLFFFVTHTFMYFFLNVKNYVIDNFLSYLESIDESYQRSTEWLKTAMTSLVEIVKFQAGWDNSKKMYFLYHLDLLLLSLVIYFLHLSVLSSIKHCYSVTKTNIYESAWKCVLAKIYIFLLISWDWCTPVTYFLCEKKRNLFIIYLHLYENERYMLLTHTL